MKKLILPLVIGASALFASAASAAPLSNGLSVMPDNGIENVRLVCDDAGRCYRTRGGGRVVIEREYVTATTTTRATGITEAAMATMIAARASVSALDRVASVSDSDSAPVGRATL